MDRGELCSGGHAAAKRKSDDDDQAEHADVAAHEHGQQGTLGLQTLTIDDGKQGYTNGLDNQEQVKDTPKKDSFTESPHYIHPWMEFITDNAGAPTFADFVELNQPSYKDGGRCYYCLDEKPATEAIAKTGPATNVPVGSLICPHTLHRHCFEELANAIQDYIDRGKPKEDRIRMACGLCNVNWVASNLQEVWASPMRDIARIFNRENSFFEIEDTDRPFLHDQNDRDNLACCIRSAAWTLTDSTAETWFADLRATALSREGRNVIAGMVYSMENEVAPYNDNLCKLSDNLVSAGFEMMVEKGLILDKGEISQPAREFAEEVSFRAVVLLCRERPFVFREIGVPTPRPNSHGIA